MIVAATNLIDDLRMLEEPKPLWIWGMMAAGVVLIGLGLWKLRRDAARRAAERLAASPEHAHEDALAALEKAHELVRPGNSRPYAIEVSAIVRRYIEHRFGIIAPRRSTEEFLIEARNSPKLEKQHQEALSKFLADCDFLKFARGVAEISELETMHNSAVHFVSQTRVVEEPAPTAEKEAVV